MTPVAAARNRVLVVSASDSRFMPFLRSMVSSLRRAPGSPKPAFDGPDLACFDLGLVAADKAWLAGEGVVVTVPRAHLGVQAGDHNPALLSFLARPFLREYFPGYDIYVWIDSDVWLQDPSVLDRYVAGAVQSGMAATHERERGYRFQAWLFGWTAKHMLLGYGPLTAAHLLGRPHVNAGFFAIHRDAPHWSIWASRYADAIGRTGALVPHDQFALNHALYAGPRGGPAPATTLLGSGCNWICDRGVPMWNDGAGAFCKPYAPYEPIAAVHLAGPAKRTDYVIWRTGGGSFRTFILRGASPSHPVAAPPLSCDSLALAG